MNNFKGTLIYKYYQPWVYNERSDGSILADLFVYVDVGHPIEPAGEVCWEASKRWGSMFSCMGIQFASRKVWGPSMEPGAWVGTVTHTTDGVHGLVYQYIRDKARRLIFEILDIETEGKDIMDRENIESIRGFLVYVDRTYQEANP